MSDVTSDTLYCANHPQVATSLRCNRCNRPICTRCAVRTPVGYRCRDCVRSQQQVFETALWYDYAVAVVLAAVLGFVSSLLLSLVGRFLIFVIFLAPVAGGITAEVVRAAVRRRRGRRLPLAAVAGFVLGCLPLLGLPLLGALLTGSAGQLLGLLLPLVYVVLASSTLYARLRGIAV